MERIAKPLYLLLSTFIFFASSTLMANSKLPVDYKGENAAVASSSSTSVISFKQQFHPFFAVAAGYGNFRNTLNSDGSTTVGRASVGSLWDVTQNISFGGEFGIQSGNRMALTTDLWTPDAAPIILTVKPPVDLLAIGQYHFNSPIFIQIKAGIVYLRTMSDVQGISSESKVEPEIQASLGYDLSEHYRLSVVYQRFFGQTPKLSNLDVTAGTANLKHVPTWEAGFIALEIKA